MARQCSICIHDEREEIDRLLVANGTPLRKIAERFGTSTTTLHRHKTEHLPVKLVAAQEAAEVAEADDLLAQVISLKNKALELLRKAESAGDYRTALAGIREARACVELLAELEGELDRRATVNITVFPAWVELRAVIVNALAVHPDALRDVVAALGDGDE